MRSSVKLAVPCALLLAGPYGRTQSVYVSLIETRVTVTDRSGKFVPDLDSDDFQVYDNGARQQISSLSRKLQAPLSVALLIDRSQSVKDRFDFLAEAAAAFVQSAVRKDEDQGLVVGFDSKVYLLQDWTSDAAALAKAIGQLSAAGGTSLFDALYKTCRDKFDVTESRRKIVVLLSDGEDSTSQASADDALRMAKLWGVSIYVVGVKADASLNTRELHGRHVLKNLAELTGGRAYFPSTQREERLQPLFERLQEELRNEYTVSYYLQAPPDNSFHQVRVETTDPNLTVHAPKGFYARKL
jgi:Ca-activated chloride channel homolog